MSWRASPAWLLELQERFGHMLRAPLDRSQGELRAVSEAYDPALVGVARPDHAEMSRARLAVYNRQYWFRLFTVLQGIFPLTARLLGFWHFNHYAAQHLAEQPPRGWDVDDIGAGFADFLSRADVDEAVAEAARIDAAYHDVFHAPSLAAHQFSPDEAARLPMARLRRSPAVALLREHWPLCELRQQVLASKSEAKLALESRLIEPRRWLLRREELRLVLAPLAPREAELLELLGRAPVAAALAELEARCSAEERLQLPGQAQAWLGRSVQLGVWVGVDFE